VTAKTKFSRTPKAVTIAGLLGFGT